MCVFETAFIERCSNARPFIKISQSSVTTDYRETHNPAQVDPLVSSILFYGGSQILGSPCLNSAAGK